MDENREPQDEARPDPSSPRIWDPERKRWTTEEELTAASEPEVVEPESTQETAKLPPAAFPETEITYEPRREPSPAPLPGWLTLALAAALGAVLAIVALLFFPGPLERRLAVEAPPAPFRPEAAFDPIETIRDVRPSVVSVFARTEDTTRSGTGAILGGNGIVAVPLGVVEGAEALEVMLHSGRRVAAELVGSDPHTRIAILSIDGDGLTAVIRGSAEFVRLGEPVVAVAAPQSRTTVSSGVVASIGRTIDTGEDRRLRDTIGIETGGVEIAEGALVAGFGGAVLGIVSAGHGPARERAVIPIDVVWWVHDHLIEDRDVTHPWIGLEVTALEDDLRLPEGVVGLGVVEVDPEGPAAGAGVRRGDVIVGVDGDRVEGALTLLARMLDRRREADIELVLWRDGDLETVSVRMVGRATTT